MNQEQLEALLLQQGHQPVTQEDPVAVEADAAPAVDVEVTEDEPGLLARAGEIAADVGLGVVGGVRDAAQEIGETVQFAGEGLGNAITGGRDLFFTEDDGFEWLTKEEVKARTDIPEWQTRDLFGETLSLPDVADNETVAGNLTRGITQFVAGFGAIGRGLKLAKATTKGGAVAKAMGQGAVTDFAAFDAHEARMSDFLRDTTPLADPITEYLQSNASDSVFEGKMKNAVEGLGLGVATEGVVRVVKAFKKAKAVQIKEGGDAATAVINEEIEQMVDDGVQLDLFDDVSDPNLANTGAGPSKVVVDGKTKAAPKAEAQAAPAEGAAEVSAHNAPKDLPKREAVDTAALQSQIDFEIGMVKGGSMPDPERAVTGELFNLGTHNVDASVKDVLNMASRAVKESALKDPTTFAKISKEANAFIADSIDVSPEVIDGSLRKMANSMEDQQALVVAGKQLINSLARNVEELAFKISSGKASDEDYNLLVNLQSRLIETSGNLKSVITGAAQTTSAGRIRTTDVITDDALKHADIVDQLHANIEKAGGRGQIDDLARAIVLNKESGGGASGVMRITTDRKNGGFWGVANEVRINGLLSSLRTQEINLASTLANTALLPAERILGGIRTMDPAMIREGGRQYIGVARAIKDSFRMAGVAFRRGRGILDPEASILEANGSDFRAIRSESENPFLRGLVNGTGTIIRLPSRGLLTGDELFKQINYRANLYARLHTQAADLVAQGQITKADASSFVHDRMKTAFNADGTARSKADLQFAREATFTQELRAGSMARGLQNASNRHPMLKVLLPFVRTPTNIVVAVGQRTPIIRRLSKTLADDLNSGDPSRVASAKGRMITGNMLWGSAILAAQQGNITGGGPTDPAARSTLNKESGWRPYSIRVTQDDGSVKYIEYRRGDPYAMFFGIAADIAEIGGMLDDQQREGLAAAGMAAIVNNLGSKTWLQGITDAAQAYSDGERYAERYLNNLAVSFIPYSSMLRDVRKATDPVLRDVKGDPNAAWFEMQSTVDTLKNTLPGFSKSLPAKRSWITGKPILYPQGLSGRDVGDLAEAQFSVKPMIDPTATSTDTHDPVLEELNRLPDAIGAPTRDIRGVEMTPKQYSRYLEIHGTTRVGRFTLYERLEKEIEKTSYDKERNRFGDASDGSLDRRTRIVRKVVTGYRKAAQAKLLQEFPELRAQIEGRIEEARANNRAAFGEIIDLGQ